MTMHEDSATGSSSEATVVGAGPMTVAADPAPSCPACGSAALRGAGSGTSPYIYALGKVEPRFPSPSVEREFSQAVGRAETARMTDREALHAVLTQRQNRYLVRQMCWVLTIQGLDTYILLPRDSADLELFIDALRPTPGPEDQDVVIGLRNGIAPPEMCNGLMVPVVLFDQIYSFDRSSLIESIPQTKDLPEKSFRAAAAEVFDRILQMAGNTGAGDEHRAMNYLVVRYPAIYARTAEAFAQDLSLSAVDVRASPLSGPRKIVEVIFSYTNRKTDFMEKYFVRVDVTEEFPFLVTKLTPYIDR